MKSTFAGLDLGSEEFAGTVRTSLAQVEELLLSELASGDDVMTEAASHLAKAGGKRFRPMFAILAAQFGPRPDASEVITAATVVEMIHLATFYHDDVMDEAARRAPMRGGPTASRSSPATTCSPARRAWCRRWDLTRCASSPRPSPSW